MERATDKIIRDIFASAWAKHTNSDKTQEMVQTAYSNQGLPNEVFVLETDKRRVFVNYLQDDEPEITLSFRDHPMRIKFNHDGLLQVETLDLVVQRYADVDGGNRFNCWGMQRLEEYNPTNGTKILRPERTVCLFTDDRVARLKAVRGNIGILTDNDLSIALETIRQSRHSILTPFDLPIAE